MTVTAEHQPEGWTADTFTPFCLHHGRQRCTGRPVWRITERHGRLEHVGYWCVLHIPDDLHPQKGTS